MADILNDIGNSFLGLKAFDALGRSIADAVSSFTEPAARLENAAASLGVMLGDNSGAEKLTQSLQRMATNGVVSFEELLTSAKTLSAVMSDDSAIAHYVGVFADIAAASDMTAGELASMAARMDDASQAPARLATLSAKGVPIVEALAAVLRKSTDEIQAMAKAARLATELGAWCASAVCSRVSGAMGCSPCARTALRMLPAKAPAAALVANRR